MFLERKLKSELDNGLSSQGRLYEINIFDQPQQGLWVLNFETNSLTLGHTTFLPITIFFNF